LYLFFNQKFYQNNAPLIAANSKAFRYGELVFETIRFSNDQIHFFAAHYERLKKAATLLQISFPKLFSGVQLKTAILQLLQKNKLQQARIRVTVFKGCGGLFEREENVFNLLIETYPLQEKDYSWNSNGLDLCYFEAIKKTTDAFSNFKTGNFLLYDMAAAHAKNQQSNESLILNTNNHICDSTISNIFLIKNGSIYTPPLTDGAIQGIFRQYLIQKIPGIITLSLNKELIAEADEVFLTNAIHAMGKTNRK
jgi:branched-chain amino acid aminotransferase